MNSRWNSLTAVAGGWAALELLAGVVVVALSRLAPWLGLDASGVDGIATMVVLPIAAYVGGFVAATIAKRRKIAHAVTCGALAVAARFVLAIWEANQGIEPISIPILVFTALWIIGFCGFGAIHARNRLLKRPARGRA